MTKFEQILSKNNVNFNRPMQNEWNWPFSRPESFHPVMTWLNAKLR